MKPQKTRKALAALLLLLCCCFLAGCPLARSTGQAEDDDAYQAAEHFLAALQTGDYQTAMAYLEQGNDLLYILPAGQGEESVPLLDPVYQLFCQQLNELTYTVSREDTGLFDTVNIQIGQRDYGGAIQAAMLEALEKQAKEGGSAFADLAGWMRAGVETAQSAQPETCLATFAAKKGGHYLQHRGVPDETFLNLLTGGFYDYADISMTTCTQTTPAGHEYRYYLAAAGDRVLACLLCEYYDSAPQDEAAINAYREEFLGAFAQQPGIYQDVRVEEGKVVTSLGIDFGQANQNFLMKLGMVSGKYQGNFTADYLSLRSTIHSFAQDGLDCATIPAYPEDQK